VFCHVAHDDWERRRGDVAREGREKRGVTKDHTRREDAGGILVTNPPLIIGYDVTLEN
jgi:hypothetical protein